MPLQDPEVLRGPPLGQSVEQRLVPEDYGRDSLPLPRPSEAPVSRGESDLAQIDMAKARELEILQPVASQGGRVKATWCRDDEFTAPVNYFDFRFTGN